MSGGLAMKNHFIFSYSLKKITFWNRNLLYSYSYILTINRSIYIPFRIYIKLHALTYILFAHALIFKIRASTWKNACIHPRTGEWCSETDCFGYKKVPMSANIYDIKVVFMAIIILCMDTKREPSVQSNTRSTLRIKKIISLSKK